MPDWPDIADHELCERLALNDEAFVEYVERHLGLLGPREFTAEAFAHGLAYPWERPGRSFVLHDDHVRLIHELDAQSRRDMLRRFVHPGRTPLLAIGSNAAPDVLRRKFGHFEAAEDRDVLVIAGHLHEFDVGASAHPAIYGAMPATLFPSRGTAARTAILWLTVAQFTQLVWSELSYFLGRLSTRFEADEPEFDVDEVMVFISRWGAFCVDGEPVALAAVPARKRTARAYDQRELLAVAAELVLGPEATPETLVRALFADFGGLVPRVAKTVRTQGRRFDSPRWTRYPAA